MEPVEFLEVMGDVGPFREVKNETSRRVLYGLQPLQEVSGDSCVESVSVVQATGA